MVSWCLCLVFLSLSSFASTQLEGYDYCDPKLKLCQEPSDHTMCKFPIPGLSAQCTPAVHEALSATERKRILFWHNKFRSNVATGTERNKNRKLPTSSNMRQLYWDKELEAIAGRWAEQCVSTKKANIYDKCRNTRRFQVSQNVGTRVVNNTLIDKQAPQIVISWYKEGKDFDSSLVDSFPEVGIEKMALKQFSNIIWAETYAIGCSRVIFQEQLPDETSSQKITWTAERLVCNYGPGGNQVRKPVYKRGVSCENCPTGTQCSSVYPGLCATQNAEKVETQQNVETAEPKEERTTAQTETSSEEIKSTVSAPTSFVRRMEEEEEELYTKVESQTTGYTTAETTGSTIAETTSSCLGEECTRREGLVSTEGITLDQGFFEVQKSSKSSGGKFLVKSGVFINGKCHCSDIQRSEARSQSPMYFRGFLVILSCRLYNLLVSYF